MNLEKSLWPNIYEKNYNISIKKKKVTLEYHLPIRLARLTLIKLRVGKNVVKTDILRPYTEMWYDLSG